MITQTAGETCEIEAFLLSCRVISRTVETAMLSFLAAESRARGLTALRGWLPAHGQERARRQTATGGMDSGSCPKPKAGVCWALDLTRADVACPEWIDHEVPSTARKRRPSQPRRPCVRPRNTWRGWSEVNTPYLNRIRSIFSDIFQVPLEEVTAQSSPDTIPNWDSLQHLNLVLALEQEFHIQFTPEEIEELLSVELVAALLDEKRVVSEVS